MRGSLRVPEAARKLIKSSGDNDAVPRNAVALMKAVEALGRDAFEDGHSREDPLVVPLTPGKRYVIYDYDGTEWITEMHRAFDAKTRRWVFPKHGKVVTCPRPKTP